MRRLVAALVILMVAASLAACGGSGAGAGAAAPAAPAATATAATAGTPVSSDIYSPTQTVQPYQQFPIDRSQVPSSVLEKLANRMPVILYWFDPTTQVSKDQGAEFNAIMPKYRGLIELESIDYTQTLATTGTPSGMPAVGATSTKYALMTGLLKVTTTPYVVFVDRFGRITYRYAGFVDRTLLEREILRATQ
jgi:hypothetical protein